MSIELRLLSNGFESIREDVNTLNKKIDLIMENTDTPFKERWINSESVCLGLDVSKRTLQTYRDNGTLAFSQVGSKIYYKASDVEAHLEKHYNKSFQDC